MVAGVLGGLGEYFDIEPTILRLAFVVLSIFTWVVTGVVIYIIAVIIIPSEPDVTFVRTDDEGNSNDSKSE